MKELNLQQMERIVGGQDQLTKAPSDGGGGCSRTTEQVIATVGAVAGIGSAFGPIGLAIFGPTALGMGIASLYCAYN